MSSSVARESAMHSFVEVYFIISSVDMCCLFSLVKRDLCSSSAVFMEGFYSFFFLRRIFIIYCGNFIQFYDLYTNNFYLASFVTDNSQQ